MKRYRQFILAAVGLAMLEVVGVPDNTVHAAAPAPCEMRLRVELTPAVPDPGDAGFVSSLLGNHPEYRLTLQGQDLDNRSVIAVDLTGPGPAGDCGEVVRSMRKDARVMSVQVEQNEASAVPAVSMTTKAVQPLGTMRSEPDGDWVLEPLNGVSFAQVARDRYACDNWAAEQTGFDPTTDDGGVPPDGVTEKRMQYLRAEAACFQAHGYLLK